MKHLYLKEIYFRTPIFLRLIIAVLLTMTLFGAVIHFVEPENFPSIFDGVWWAFVTAATIGYGDYVPLTPTGKLVGILLILTGGGILAFYITHISAAVLKHEHNLEKGLIAYKGENHYIFIGWNERSKKILNRIKAKDPGTEFVIIDHSMGKLPTGLFPVHFIKGEPSSDKTLQLANIQQAKAVMITADENLSPKQADVHTVLSAIAIRGNHATIKIIAELLTDLQVGNAIRAGTNTIIRTDDCISSIFFHELFHLHAANPFEDLLQLLNSQQFTHDTVPKNQVGTTFFELMPIWKAQGKLLLGFIRAEQYTFNPPSDTTLQQHDILLSITAWE